jgi:uncharacterized protein YcbK (DUF882 family)
MQRRELSAKEAGGRSDAAASDADSPADTLSRRHALRGLGLALPGVLLLSPWRCLRAAEAERSLSFRHTHTGEALDIVYHRHGDYDSDALRQIDYLLRDFRSDQVHEIDTELLDLLHELQSSLGGGTYEVVSGYRSPGTNALLRSKSPGVARRSLHMQGRAVDARLTGVELASLRRAALELERGGVGYYPASDFVHLDTGRFRIW